jgi:hypothetical protein
MTRNCFSFYRLAIQSCPVKTYAKQRPIERQDSCACCYVAQLANDQLRNYHLALTCFCSSREFSTSRVEQNINADFDLRGYILSANNGLRPLRREMAFSLPV